MNIYNDICTVLRSDGRAMVATIVRASGSTPAPEASMMLVRVVPPFKATGSIGGGCIDEHILWCVKENPDRTQNRLFTFNLNDPVGDTGLTCGGTIDVLLEPLDRSALPVYEDIANAQELGEDRVLESFIPGLNGMPGRHIQRTIRASPHLVVFGGGHVGNIVVKCASLAGFRVTLVDDRPAYANADRTPEAKAIICAPFDEAIAQLHFNESTSVVIVTRGHKHDEHILEQIVTRDLRYVGMIGSRRKVAVTFGNLRERGVPEERLARVHAPVGLDIGAETPGEIAVSIVAELIAVHRKTNQQLPSRKLKNQAHMDVASR